MVKRWRDIQEDIYRERREPKELTGCRWVKTMLREIFSFVAVLAAKEWKRNEIKTTLRTRLVKK